MPQQPQADTNAQQQQSNNTNTTTTTAQTPPNGVIIEVNHLSFVRTLYFQLSRKYIPFFSHG